MKKPRKSKIRNGYTIPAKARKSGAMRDKRSKRNNGKNKQQKYLDENNDME